MDGGTNDFSKAIARAIDNGSHFYTLSYTPSNPKMDGQFRSIEVSIPEAKYTLAYRKGYYALDSDHAPSRVEEFAKGEDSGNSECLAAAADCAEHRAPLKSSTVHGWLLWTHSQSQMPPAPERTPN